MVWVVSMVWVVRLFGVLGVLGRMDALDGFVTYSTFSHGCIVVPLIAEEEAWGVGPQPPA